MSPSTFFSLRSLEKLKRLEQLAAQIEMKNNKLNVMAQDDRKLAQLHQQLSQRQQEVSSMWDGYI